MCDCKIKHVCGQDKIHELEKENQQLKEENNVLRAMMDKLEKYVLSYAKTKEV